MILRRTKTAGKAFMIVMGNIILMCCFFNTWGNTATIIQKEDGPTGEIIIDVREKAEVGEDAVLLKDIAVIWADEEMKNRIENIKISIAPRPGNSSVIPGGRITSVMRNNKWLPENAQISVPGSVWVERQFQVIPDDLLDDYFKDYIAKKIGDSSYELSQFKVRGAGKYPVGSLSLETLDQIKRKKNANGVAGRLSLNVAVKVNGSEEGRISLSGWVQRIEKVVTAKRAISRNSVVTEEDVSLNEIKLSTAPSQFLVSMDDVLGKRAKRNIPQGTCLKQNMLDLPLMVQKGDQVKIVAKNGLLTVTAFGIAEGEGAVGEQIEVRNINSDKPVTGVVRDKSVVEVLF